MSKSKKPGGGGRTGEHDAPHAAPETFGYLPRLPSAKVSEYRRLERALESLRERLRGLTFADAATPRHAGDAEGNGFAPGPGQYALAGALVEFWTALNAAAGADRKRFRETAWSLSDHISHAHHAAELLRAGAVDDLPEGAPVGKRRRLAALWVYRAVRWWPRFGDADIIWHRVELHLQQYADALLSALRPSGLDAGELSDRQRDILQALFRQSAFDIDHRMTTDEITEAVEGKGRGSVASFKRQGSEPQWRGLIDTKTGRGTEFVVLVGKTSKARKGTSWGRVNQLLEEAEAQWAAERVQTGLSSGEGLIWAVRDPIMKRERIKEKGSVRYEEVEADPGVADKRLLVYEPEFANVLKQTERQGNTLSAILRVAWDGRDLRSMTKNSPARATGAHVSLIGHITADELRRYLTQTETANGFGNRFLWICADRSKQLPEGGVIDPAALDALRDELADALTFARSAGEVRRDDEARTVWCEVYGELSDGKPGLAGALLARGEAHVMRLALLYALLDKSPLIRAPHLMAALALWGYAERSVYHVFGDNLGDPIADELLRLLRSCPNGLTRTEIRDYFQRHASADRIGRALGMLLQHKLARREQVPTGGRSSERWYAIGRKGG